LATAAAVILSEEEAAAEDICFLKKEGEMLRKRSLALLGSRRIPHLRRRAMSLTTIAFISWSGRCFACTGESGVVFLTHYRR
jgi:hypothetical protein